ncbi:MAG: hypothetical protein SGILL_003550 [Bacillariaceae sp.]
MLLWAERDLSVETLTQNLDLVLRVLPEEAIAGQQAYEQAQQSSAVSRSRANRQVSSNAATSNPSDMTSSSTLESMDQDMAAAIRASTQPDAEVGNVLHNDEVCREELAVVSHAVSFCPTARELKFLFYVDLCFIVHHLL